MRIHSQHSHALKFLKMIKVKFFLQVLFLQIFLWGEITVSYITHVKLFFKESFFLICCLNHHSKRELTCNEEVAERPERGHEAQHGTPLLLGLELGEVRPNNGATAAQPGEENNVGVTLLSALRKPVSAGLENPRGFTEW